MTTLDPSPVLDGARVLAYAIVDNSVVYEERGCLFADGKLLGPVPRIAICKYLDRPELMVIFCDAEWKHFAATDYKTVEEAKAQLERSYHGLLDKWVDTKVTEAEARAFLEKEYADEKCSFCGRWPNKVQCMIGDAVRICNYCVDEFYILLHSENKA